MRPILSRTNRIQIQTPLLILNQPSKKAGRLGLRQTNKRRGEGSYPLGMVLQACGGLADYAKHGQISNWRDFLATAAVVRPMLGISPSAWEEAQRVMGEVKAAIVVACILERSATINSAGGYLRGLTAKAGAGEFSLGPILMAQMNARLKKTKMRA